MSTSPTRALGLALAGVVALPLGLLLAVVAIDNNGLASGSAANAAAIRGGLPADAIVSPGTWTYPLGAWTLGSGFRTRSRPEHQGVDLIAPRGTPIRAASAGRVTRVVCNSSTGTCDVDGGVSVRGCGWYVDILHPGPLVTRYCHMWRRPFVVEDQTVQGGQLIGLVGSSGNSSGPHLHYEVHAGRVATGANPINPLPFMATAGAALSQ